MTHAAENSRAAQRSPRASNLAQYPPALVLLSWLRERWRGFPIALTPRLVAKDLMMHYQTVQKARDVLIECGSITAAPRPKVARGVGRPPILYILKLPLR